MHLRESLAVAIDALRSNKLRAVLTSIGVIIGSASIVLVVTVALTSRKFVISQIEAVGSNLVWAEMIKTPDKVQPLSHELTLDDMDAVAAEIPGVVTVAGVSDMPMTVVVEGQARPVALIGVTLGYQRIRRLIILRGRFFDSGDMETRSKVCLITKELALHVFGVENPVGRNIRCHPRKPCHVSQADLLAPRQPVVSGEDEQAGLGGNGSQADVRSLDGRDHEGHVRASV